MNDTSQTDALAAEYVLGTLDANERAVAQALMAADEQFVVKVKWWERRLGELHLMVEPVEPEVGIWERIKSKMPPQSSAGRTPEPQVSEPQMLEPQVSEPQVLEPQVLEPQVSEPQCAGAASAGAAIAAATSAGAGCAPSRRAAVGSRPASSRRDRRFRYVAVGSGPCCCSAADRGAVAAGRTRGC